MCYSFVDESEHKKQYIYHKTFKEDCGECMNSNLNETIYCLCSNSNHNTYSVVLLPTFYTLHI